MFPSFLLALREGLEAALIMGIVLGVLKKIQRTQFNKTVWFGASMAALLSAATALTLNVLGESFTGATEGIFEGFAMLIAAGVLTWMIFWMQRQARLLKSELEIDVRRAVMQQSGKALFVLAFIAVFREGIELALFLTAAAFTSTAQQAFIGGLLGLISAAVIGWILFVTTIRFDLRRFFQVTSALLILFAAGLVAYGVHEFNEVGWIPSIVEHVWDVNPILDEGSTFGLIIKALFGYNGNPSLTEILAYVLYFFVILLGLRWNSSQPITAVQKA